METIQIIPEHKAWLIQRLNEGNNHHILLNESHGGYHVCPELLDDEDVIMAAIRNNPVGTRSCIQVLRIASDRLKDKPEVVLAAAIKDTSEFFDASDRLKDDKPFVMDLVSRNARAIRSASPRLKKDEDVAVAMAGAPQAGNAIRYVDRDLLRNKRFMLAWLNGDTDGTNLLSSTEADNPLRDDDEVGLAAVSKDGKALRELSERLQQKPEIIAAAKASAAYEEYYTDYWRKSVAERGGNVLSRKDWVTRTSDRTDKGIV